MKSLFLAGTAMLALTAGAHARTLNVQMNADLRDSRPGVNRDGNSDGIMVHLVEGLVGYTEAVDVVPLIAESVDISEDGTTFTFALRDGVTFHNGEPLTSAEVLWSWNYYMDPATEWSCRPDFDGSRTVEVTSVEAPDEATVVMTIAEPSAVFLGLLARPECGQTGILHPDSVGDDGEWLAPVGTGPFKWGEWRKGEYVQLEAFENYVSPENDGTVDGLVGSKRPLVDAVRFMVVPDGAAVAAGIRSGAIDLASISPDLLPEFENNPDIQLFNVRNHGNNVLYFQTRDPVLENVEIRRAIAESIDLPQLVEVASGGVGIPNMSMISVDSVYYSDVQATMTPYDPDSARQRLAAAGYNGEPISIIANMRGNVPSYPAAIVAQAMMQQVGINSQIEVLDYATQTDRRRNGQGQILSVSIGPRFDPSLTYSFFVGDKDADSGKLWDDPRAIELVDRSYTTFDQAERQAIFDELHLLMLEEMPAIFIYNMNYSWIAPSSLEGAPVWESYPRAWEISIAD